MALDDKRYNALLLAHNAADTPEIVVDRATTYLSFLDKDPKDTLQEKEDKEKEEKEAETETPVTEVTK